MDYVELTESDRRAMVRQRIRGVETEHYQHTLNAAVERSTHAPEQEQANTAKALRVLEEAHVQAVAELAKLGPEKTDTADTVEGVPVG